MRPTGVKFCERTELSLPTTDHVVTSQDHDVPIDANEGPNIVIHSNDDVNSETSDVPVQTSNFQKPMRNRRQPAYLKDYVC